MARRKFLSVREVAELLGYHPETVREMARKKQLPAIKFGGRTSPYRFSADAIDAHIASLEAKHARRIAG